MARGQNKQCYTAEGSRDQYGGLTLKSFSLCFQLFKHDNQPEAPSLRFQKPKKLAGPQGTCSTTTMSHWGDKCADVREMMPIRDWEHKDQVNTDFL